VTTAAPPAVVARWEWRTFGEAFAAVEERLGGADPERVQTSDELYLVSLASDASVKIRDDLLDVKQLQHVNRDGLEQWLPVMKASFPVDSAQLRTVLDALGASSIPLRRDRYTLDQLLTDVVGPSVDLRALQVHKHRRHFTIDGCMIELSEVRTFRGTTQTIAIESPDPDLVSRTVAALGLADRPNVCLARGLKTLTGFEAVRYAVIDVGTNSVKFHIGERHPDGTWKTIVDRAEITRLGEHLDDSGRLQRDAVDRTAQAIGEMVEEARRDGVAAVAAVGTAGLRIAPNSSELVELVREHCGVTIEVISGEEEARLAYLAATTSLPVTVRQLVVFDTGGGSSQFSFGDGRKVAERFSVEVGAVRFTEQFGLDGVVDDERLAEARAAIAADLTRLDKRPKPDAVIGMGGAVTNLAAVKHKLSPYDPDVVHGTVLDRAELDRQIELYRTSTADERREIRGLQPKRAEVILAGALIVRTILEKLVIPSLTVSDRGLRHGLLVERFGE
jgi:exopolyphosphatase / guanosine-5'-triphosphate,3'-diphosphate pyrophosphatase